MTGINQNDFNLTIINTFQIKKDLDQNLNTAVFLKRKFQPNVIPFAYVINALF